MKSEKAKDKIKSSLLLHGLDEDIPVLTQGSAICAVEIAEDEMRERAIEAFKWWLIEYYSDADNQKIIDKHLQKFIQQLEKQEKP